MNREDLDLMDQIMKATDQSLNLASVTVGELQAIIQGLSNTIKESDKALLVKTKEAVHWLETSTIACQMYEKYVDESFKARRKYAALPLWQKIKIHFSKKKLDY